DWSSDVCSSDLFYRVLLLLHFDGPGFFNSVIEFVRVVSGESSCWGFDNWGLTTASFDESFVLVRVLCKVDVFIGHICFIQLSSHATTWATSWLSVYRDHVVLRSK